MYFQSIVTKQIDETKLLLNDKWYGMLKKILLRGLDIYVDKSNPKALKRMYDSIAALMTQNLSDITMRSLKMFTDFMCDFEVC